MMLPLRPVSSRTFQSGDALGLVAYLQSQDFVLTLDTPDLVRLERPEESITIAADGVVTISGEMVERAYQRLLFVCEEK
jgi:hypothetical protein